MAKKKWRTRALSREAASAGLDLEPGSYVLKCGVPLIYDFHWVVGEDHTKDDTVTLEADDGGPKQKQTVLLSDPQQAEPLGDDRLRVTFAVTPGRSYKLIVDPGLGPDGEALAPYSLFERQVIPSGAGDLAPHPDDDATGGEDLDTDPFEDDDYGLDDDGAALLRDLLGGGEGGDGSPAGGAS